MSKQVIIDKVNIHLANGWQSDPTQLARKVAEQIQRQVGDLDSAKQVALSLQGHFAGVDSRVVEAISTQLSSHFAKFTLRGDGT